MPIDTSIALGVRPPQFQTIDPMTIYSAMENQRINALREQMIQQDMAKNAMIMQNTMEDRRAAAAKAARDLREQQEMLRVLQGGRIPARDVVMGPGTIQASTPAGYDFEGVKNKMLERGSLSGYEALSKAQEQEANRLKAQRAAETESATGAKVRAETKGLDLKNLTDEFNSTKTLISSAGSPDAVLSVFDAKADLIRGIGGDPEKSKRDFLAMLDNPQYGETPSQRFQNAVLHVSSGIANMQKQISDLATAKAGRTEVITGADGNTYLLDKSTGDVRMAGAPAASAPAAGAPVAGAPVAGAPAAGAPALFRAAPTTDAQIKQAARKQALPAAIEEGERTIKYLEEMIGSDNLGVDRPASQKIPEHPGFQSAVGATAPWNWGARYFSGSDTADFEARHGQIEGGAFLKAYETLKGTGQITEKEGEKATAAISRMKLSQSEKEYTAAAREFADIIQSAIKRAKNELGSGTSATTAPSAAPAASSTNIPAGWSHEVMGQ